MKFFKMYFHVKIFLLLNNCKNQIPHVNFHVAYNLVEMEFLSNR